METVEILIRLPKDTFDAVGILQAFVGDTHLINGYQIDKNSTFGTMIKAIASGTVLPKGHGKLKDYDAIISRYGREVSVMMSEGERLDLLCGIVDDAETVIAADKGGEE